MTASYGKGAKGKATVLHSKIVRSRGHCERCGGHERLQCAHIVRRTYSHTRTDTANAWCLCASCHFKVDGDAYEFTQLVKATVGEEFWQHLRKKAQDGVRVKFDWDAELERLQDVWAGIEASR
jgi:hypothetical protein